MEHTIMFVSRLAAGAALALAVARAAAMAAQPFAGGESANGTFGAAGAISTSEAAWALAPERRATEPVRAAVTAPAFEAVSAPVVRSIRLAGPAQPSATFPAGATPSAAATATATATPAVGASATVTALPDLILDSRRVQMSGRYAYRRVVLRGTTTIEIGPYSGTHDTGWLEIVAESITIDRQARIVGDGAGYRGQLNNDGEGPGGGEGGVHTPDGGGGGGHGGRGGDGVMDGQPMPGARGGKAYGDARSRDIDRGSAGGAPGTADGGGDAGYGANGGAALSLLADTVAITGSISVNGLDGAVVAVDAAGGGAGGGVLIQARRLEQTGRIQAVGGGGATEDDGGGGGGGGRIKIFYVTGSVNQRVLDVSGGRGDGNGYQNNGQRGTVYIEVATPTATPTNSRTPVASATATRTPSPKTTPTPTPTPTTTASATATASPTWTSTATPTATASPTPTPGDLYLPVAHAYRCLPVEPASIALMFLIDSSTTMAGPGSAGRTKLEEATDAARVAVDIMRHTGDRIGIVTFDAGARVVAPLTGDKDALRGALGGIATTTRGSRLNEGLALAARELTAQGADARWMVVITDGLPNPSTPADAVAAADSARASGVRLDVLGLGSDQDEAVLAAIADGPAHYLRSPQRDRLEALFAPLARPPCVQ